MFVCSQRRGVGPRRQRLDSLYWYCCKGVSEIQIKFSINWYLSRDIYRPKTRRGGIGCPAPKIHINYLQLVKTLTWHLLSVTIKIISHDHDLQEFMICLLNTFSRYLNLFYRWLDVWLHWTQAFEVCLKPDAIVRNAHLTTFTNI